MSRTTWLCIACVLALATGCEKDNPFFCPGANPNNNCAEIDAPPAGCTTNDQCEAPAAVCEVGSGTCVECVAPDQVDACTGTSPVCGDDNACRGCAAHAECAASNACLPDGACADETDVAYVDPEGSGAECSQAAPCGTIAAALATGRPIVKLAAGVVKDNKATTIDGKAVTILADPGTTLDRDGDGPILEVKSADADVEIYDLAITGQTGIADAAIVVTPNGGAPSLSLTRVKVDTNQGGGISTSGGTLTVTQPTVSGNTGGGISVTNAEFDLTNNFIVKNGSATSAFGGVLVSQANTGTRNLAFNTISANGGASGSVTGVTCTLVTQAVTFSNNIVFDNQVNAGGTQVGGGGMCAYSFSDVGPDTVSGNGNINADPTFVDVAQDDFHLKAASPCKDAADPGASLDVDFDGDTRPQGDGRDIGADEVVP